MTGNTDILARNPLMGNLLNGSLNKISPPAAITDADASTLDFVS